VARVYKYPLEIGRQKISLPIGARILSVHDQEGVVTMWAFVDPQETGVQNRVFMVVGTGWDLASPFSLTYLGTSLTYLGTSHSPDGMVLHVFEEIL
jgi:hypothetical protein